MRRLIKTGIACALGNVGADQWFGSRAAARHVPLVMCYHRVVQDFGTSHRGSIPAMLTSREMLAQHLDWIQDRFRFASLDEITAHLEAGEPFREPVAAVTFDDGYSDIYYNAFPLLKRRNIPAAVFVVTGLVGTEELQLHDKVYLLAARACLSGGGGSGELKRLLRTSHIGVPELDRLPDASSDPVAITDLLLNRLSQGRLREITDVLQSHIDPGEEGRDELRPLTWAMLMEMQQEGITIGSHTKSHALLTNEGLQRVINETVESRQELGKRLGIRVKHFAYPSGKFDAATVRAVAAAYPYAYTTCFHRDADYPLLTIPRRHFWEHSCVDVLGRFSPAIMSCHVRGIFDWVSGCRQDHRVPLWRGQAHRRFSYEAS